MSANRSAVFLLLEETCVKAAPYPFEMLGDTYEVPPKKYVLKGWIGAGEVVGLVGLPFIGKSLAAGSIALCVATAQDFFGVSVDLPGLVLYVAGERAEVTKRRMRGTAKALGLADPGVAILSRGPNFIRADDVDRFIATVRAIQVQTGRQVVLVVIDTLARIMVGADENSTKDAGVVAESLSRVASETGSAILLLHHPAKGGEGGWRGSSAIVGAVDAIISLEARGDLRRLRLEQANDGPEGADLWFRVEARLVGAAEIPILVPVEPPVRRGGGQGPAAIDPLAERVGWIARHVAQHGHTVTRAALLADARAASILSGKAASGSEQLRRALVSAKDQSLVIYDDASVRTHPDRLGDMAQRPNPNVTPIRGDVLELGLDQPNRKPNGKPNQDEIGPVGQHARPNLGSRKPIGPGAQP